MPTGAMLADILMSRSPGTDRHNITQLVLLSCIALHTCHESIYPGL